MRKREFNGKRNRRNITEKIDVFRHKKNSTMKLHIVSLDLGDNFFQHFPASKSIFVEYAQYQNPRSFVTYPEYHQIIDIITNFSLIY